MIAAAPITDGGSMIEHLGAVAEIRLRVARRSRDPRLMLVPGLADDLRSIGEAFESLELSVRALARITLAKHFEYSLSTPEYRFLATLAGDGGCDPARPELAALAQAFSVRSTT